VNPLLDDEIFKLLQVRRLPARLTAPQTAALLGFEPACIPVLVAKKLLRPLGKPAPNAIRFFAARQVEQVSTDVAWLSKATQALAAYWQERNQRFGKNRHKETSEQATL
jgi:hypothetical protein